MSDYTKKCCDLVMKGGVTSGIVYPGAIQEIAKQFHYVGIGGTSAGAIAAAVTAAAEYRRRYTRSTDGFDMLQTVSDDMARPGRLLSLFKPDRSTRYYFDLASPYLEGKANAWTKFRTLGTLGWKLLGKRRRNRFIAPLITNHFGVCSGMAVDNEGSEPALTQWLSDLIDRISGTEPGRHLTFNDLHNAPPPLGCEHLFSANSRSIDFRAVTTSLTFGRPFEFPLQNCDLAFDVEEWKSLFPDSVMKQLIRAAEALDNSDHLRQENKLPLPALDLPIIVAARMSLSFPILFTAIPLWAVNHNKEGNPLEKVMFSDGGITSNFPVHRFDSIYPRWPTLAINFKGTDEHGKPLRKFRSQDNEFIYMNADRKEGLVDIWSSLIRIDNPQASFFGFLFSIFRSAQNWHDNAFLRLPGFRDRVAEVWLKPGEGGLNLDMHPDTVQSLTALGKKAGRQLADRYGSSAAIDEMSWNGHKWTRFRSGMEGLSEAIAKLGQSLGESDFDESDLWTFFTSNDTPPCYRFSNETQREDAKRITAKLLDLARELDELKPFHDGPRPATEFGSRAPI